MSDEATAARPRLQQRPPLSAGSKLQRAVWNTVWLLLCRWNPPQLHGWRRLVLGLFGARMGTGAVVYPSASVWAPWNLAMGEGSTLGPGVDCYNVDRVELGPRAVVSQRAYLCTASRDIDDSAKPLTTGPIVLGADAWVAAEAYVGPGVTLGEGAVLAARGVAVRDLDPWMVAGGNPAKPIRKRERG